MFKQYYVLRITKNENVLLEEPFTSLRAAFRYCNKMNSRDIKYRKGAFYCPLDDYIHYLDCLHCHIPYEPIFK